MKYISLFKEDKIEFLCEEEDFGIIPAPERSSKFMPNWYAKLATHTKDSRGRRGNFGMTAKKCLPMLDIMTEGYIIPLFGDVHVRTNKDCSKIDIDSQNPYGKILELHNGLQVGGTNFPLYPKPIVKFLNRWIIKTSPGWSCLFVAPANHLETRWLTLNAVVDTDNYMQYINFPVVWMENDFDDVIYSGTPIIQVIPFKRSNRLTKNQSRKLSKKEQKEHEKVIKTQDLKDHYYTKDLREKR